MKAALAWLREAFSDLRHHLIPSRSKRRFLYGCALTAGVLLLIGTSFEDFGQFLTTDVNKDHPYAYEITAACLGTALTAVLTWMLLKHQSHSEVDRDRNVKIYETKLEIYQSLLKRIEGILEDETLTTKEFFQLQLAFQEIVFIAGKRVLNEMPAFARVLASVERDAHLRENSKQRILHAFGRLASEVRADLHDPQPHGEDLHFDVEDVLAKIEANFASYQSQSPSDRIESWAREKERRDDEARKAKDREKKYHDASAKEPAALSGELSAEEAFLKHCSVVERQLYRAVLEDVRVAGPSKQFRLRWRKPGQIEPDFDSVGMVFRGKSNRIVLYIHPDRAVPNKIFSDNLSPWQQVEARKILHETWKEKGNVVSRWTFTTEDVEFKELAGLIKVLASPRPASDSGAPDSTLTAH